MAQQPLAPATELPPPDPKEMERINRLLRDIPLALRQDRGTSLLGPNRPPRLTIYQVGRPDETGSYRAGMSVAEFLIEPLNHFGTWHVESTVSGPVQIRWNGTTFEYGGRDGARFLEDPDVAIYQYLRGQWEHYNARLAYADEMGRPPEKELVVKHAAYRKALIRFAEHDELRWNIQAVEAFDYSPGPTQKTHGRIRRGLRHWLAVYVTENDKTPTELLAKAESLPELGRKIRDALQAKHDDRRPEASTG